MVNALSPAAESVGQRGTGEVGGRRKERGNLRGSRLFVWLRPWGSPTRLRRHQEERLTAVEPEKVSTHDYYYIPAPECNLITNL